MNTRPLSIRFWEKVKKSDTCWTWTGAVRGRGYGSIHTDGKDEGAHRVSYAMHYGPIPAGMRVLHRCDNPRCVKPDHLFLGTNKDNVNDKMRKGRHVVTPSYGDKAGMAKLTWHQVDEIRQKAASGWTQGRLSKAYGVPQSVISRLVRPHTWAKRE